MKLFKCQACGQLLYFENRACVNCGRRLGFIAERTELSACEPDGDHWSALAAPEAPVRFCVNAEDDACNWLVPADSSERFCVACRHNRTIPDIRQPDRLQAWRVIELAKHRLFYALLRLKLPLHTRWEDPDHGLMFEFLADPPDGDGQKVLTGHDNGLVTIALVEADDAEREKRRVAMGEPYRTLLGHFRHEVGHHYWDLLVRDGGRLDQCRAVFGDDTLDYAAALKRHYAEGPPPDWQGNFVSSYATTHPWEDFAETWAHYLHIVDTMEMARAFGVQVHPRLDETGLLGADIDLNPYEATDFDRIVRAWLPLTFALNSINRCMGQADLYPFVISAPVIAKLTFIHDLVHGR